MNLTQGKIFKTLFIYSVPLILTNAVQLLFHAADVTVLGILVNDSAVAAVGACLLNRVNLRLWEEPEPIWKMLILSVSLPVMKQVTSQDRIFR